MALCGFGLTAAMTVRAQLILVYVLLACGLASWVSEVALEGGPGSLTYQLCSAGFAVNGVILILHLVHGTLKREYRRHQLGPSC